MEIAQASFPARAIFKRCIRSLVGLQFLENSLGLRVAPDLLDKLILLAWLERTNPGEYLRRNCRQTLRLSLFDEAAELGVGLIAAAG
jgi:hypothetical protein